MLKIKKINVVLGCITSGLFLCNAGLAHLTTSLEGKYGIRNTRNVRKAQVSSNNGASINNLGNNPIIIQQNGEKIMEVSANTSYTIQNPGDYKIYDKHNHDRFCNLYYSIDQVNITKKSPYNSSPSTNLSSLPDKQLSLFSCEFDNTKRVVEIKGPKHPRFTAVTEVIGEKGAVRPFANIGTYKKNDDEPFFDLGVIFTAIFKDSSNAIHGDITYDKYKCGKINTSTCIYFDPQVKTSLNNNKQYNSIRKLGIPTILAITGSHDAHGWSCFQNEQDAQEMADVIVDLVNDYNLDGIAIDDEYKNCGQNSLSIKWIAKAIKSNANWNGRILSMYLDSSQLTESYNPFSIDKTDNTSLASYLDFGDDMNYISPAFSVRAAAFIGKDKDDQYLSPNQVSLGVSGDPGMGEVNSYDDYDTIMSIINASIKGQPASGGVMFFDVNDECTSGSNRYYSYWQLYQNNFTKVTCEDDDDKTCSFFSLAPYDSTGQIGNNIMSGGNLDPSIHGEQTGPDNYDQLIPYNATVKNFHGTDKDSETVPYNVFNPKRADLYRAYLKILLKNASNIQCTDNTSSSIDKDGFASEVNFKFNGGSCSYEVKSNFKYDCYKNQD